jgi:hypothetical protein
MTNKYKDYDRVKVVNCLGYPALTGYTGVIMRVYNDCHDPCGCDSYPCEYDVKMEGPKRYKNSHFMMFESEIELEPKQ